MTNDYLGKGHGEKGKEGRKTCQCLKDLTAFEGRKKSLLITKSK